VTCIASDLDNLRVGRDFIDAVTGAKRSHGTATIAGKVWPWESTLDQETTYKALRASAKREGARFGTFISQAAEVTP
jgi:hypothetical protein